jgi:hypothetical protein
VRLVRGEKAGITRLHLEFFARDFDAGLALEQIAHLLDAGMRVRQRAFAPLDFADDDFQV